MLILVLTKNEQDQVPIFQYTPFSSFQAHLQAAMYRFQQTNYGNRQDFSFNSLNTL